MMMVPFMEQPEHVRHKVHKKVMAKKIRDARLASQETELFKIQEAQFDSLITNVVKHGHTKVREREEEGAPERSVWNDGYTEEFKRQVNEIFVEKNDVKKRWFSKYQWCDVIILPIIRSGNIDLFLWIGRDRGLPIYWHSTLAESLYQAIKFRQFEMADFLWDLPGADHNRGYRGKEHILLFDCFWDFNVEGLQYLADKGVRIVFNEFGHTKDALELFVDSARRRCWKHYDPEPHPDYLSHSTRKKEVDMIKILFESGIQGPPQDERQNIDDDEEYWNFQWAGDRAKEYMHKNRGNAAVAYREDRDRIKRLKYRLPHYLRVLTRWPQFSHIVEETKRHINNNYDFGMIY